MHRCDYSALYEHLYVLPRRARSAQAVRHCCNRPSSTGMWCVSRPASTTVSESPAATSLGSRMGQRWAFSALESASAILEPCHTAAGGMPVQVACVPARVLIYPSIYPSIHPSIHGMGCVHVCMSARVFAGSSRAHIHACIHVCHKSISAHEHAHAHQRTRTQPCTHARANQPTPSMPTPSRTAD